MVLIEIVYCKITGKTRDLPKVHHFIPLVPWSVKKIKGVAKVMSKYDNEHDGPSNKFEKKEQIKLVLDMSNEGPMFKMLESMLRGGGQNGDKVYDALNKLIKSGIPGLEGLFSADGTGNFCAGFSKMSDEDKKRFLAAVTGSGGKIDAKAAAALIAAAASGGDPDIANKIIEKMLAGLGDEIDPAMMAALMATTALVARGASNEEILLAMQRELANSGMSQEEILIKTMLLQKAMAGDNSPAFINKTLRNALEAANISPDDLSKALFIEKAMSALGATTNDLTSLMSLQAAMVEQGVPPELILETLKLILSSQGPDSEFAHLVKDSIKMDGVSLEELNLMIAMSKGLDDGPSTDLKNKLKSLLSKGSIASAQDIFSSLQEVFDSGTLSKSSLAKTLLVQKVMTASGSSADMLSKVVHLQKALSDSGMARHEIANALTLAMAMANAETKETLNHLLEHFGDLISDDVTVEEIQMLLALAEAMSSGSMPEEVVRLFKKAMKQRRGSVENVAETLMMALAASGESQENIAKAMARALRATGATPEEIAKTMQQALEKTGASQEEICRAIAKAMAESGATPEEIAIALKATFARAMAADPHAAADIARALAEALAATGASVDDIAAMMNEAMATSLMASAGGSIEDLFEMAGTVAATLAEAGASPQEIATAMKAALSAVGKKNPEMVEELAITMAKAMAASGASGEDIVKAMQEALAATGASKEEIAHTLLAALASSRASPEVIAKTMMMALQDSGLSEEEIQEMVLQAMLESGATPEEIAKVMVEQKLLQAIGTSPDEMSKSILKQLRAGGQMTEASLEPILRSGGIDPATAARILVFQKAMSGCGLSADDVVRALLMQSALAADGVSSKTILAAVADIVNECGGISLERIEKLLNNNVFDGNLNASDVLHAIKFDSLIESGGVCLEGLRSKISESVSEAIKEMLKANSLDPEAVVTTALLQKLMNVLGLTPDLIAKMVQLEKSLFDGGASPHDIALVMSTAAKKGSLYPLTPDSLKSSLGELMTSEDIEVSSNLVDSFRCGKIPPELTSKLIMLQQAIESGVTSPEKSAQSLVALLKNGSVDPSDMVNPLKEILAKNGLDLGILESVVLLQKSGAAMGISSDDLAAVLKIQNYLTELGFSAAEIAEALSEVVGKDESGVKLFGKQMLAALEHPRVREGDLLFGTQMAKAFDFADCKGEGKKKRSPTEKASDFLRKCLDNLKLTPETLSKVLTFQKAMSVCDVTCQQMSRVVRILNELVRSEASTPLVCRTIQEAIESQGKRQNELKLKQFLQDLASGKSGVIFDADAINFTSKFRTALNSQDFIINNMKEIFENAMKVAGLTKEDVAKAALVQRALAASGVTPEILAQAVMFQKALAASGASAEEIANILSQVTSPGFSDEEIKRLLTKILDRKDISKEEIEHIQKLQNSLRAAGLGDARFNGDLSALVASGQVDLEALGRAVLMQKVLSATGLSPEHLAKALIMQKAMLDAGATSENVANCMQKALLESGLSLDELISLMGIELRNCSNLVPEDILNTLRFERVLSAAQAAKLIVKKLKPEELKLLEATLNASTEGGTASLFAAMKGLLGDILDPCTLQALEVSAAMAAAGASQEDIEEMMAMIMSAGTGGISEDFLLAIKEAMSSGGSPQQKLAALKAAMDEELSSTITGLRNTFMNKIASPEDVRRTCDQLAEKLAGDLASQHDAKLALIDLLDEALHDINLAEVHPELLFNYLMMSALASAIDQIERNGSKMNPENMNEFARKELITMIQQLLMEADLSGELEAFLLSDTSIGGIQELLSRLMSNPKTHAALTRRVAFLFDFEEVEHTTVIGLALADILKDSKHKLKPWELSRHRHIRGLRKAKVPQLSYSHVYCFYKVLPEHTDGPPIGVSYD